MAREKNASHIVSQLDRYHTKGWAPKIFNMYVCTHNYRSTKLLPMGQQGWELEISTSHDTWSLVGIYHALLRQSLWRLWSSTASIWNQQNIQANEQTCCQKTIPEVLQTPSLHQRTRAAVDASFVPGRSSSRPAARSPNPAAWGSSAPQWCWEKRQTSNFLWLSGWKWCSSPRRCPSLGLEYHTQVKA